MKWKLKKNASNDKNSSLYSNKIVFSLPSFYLCRILLRRTSPLSAVENGRCLGQNGQCWAKATDLGERSPMFKAKWPMFCQTVLVTAADVYFNNDQF